MLKFFVKCNKGWSRDTLDSYPFVGGGGRSQGSPRVSCKLWSLPR